MVRNYRACRARQKAVMGRLIKLMCAWPKNDEGGFETRPYVFSALGGKTQRLPTSTSILSIPKKRGQS
jgi:hypothetical protein